MHRPEKSPIGKFIPLFLAMVAIATCSSEKPAPPLAGPTVLLPAVELQDFGALPPLKPEVITPSLKDQAFSTDKAVNYKQVMAFLGVRLSAGQKMFLNNHRFLLIPKSATRFKGKVDLSGMAGDPFDEMLGLFDFITGSTDPLGRKPENCRLVNPDVMLHALHKYMENSLEYLEKTELAATLGRFLVTMQAKALEYQAASAGKLAEHYELIAAQLTVPLVILENARWPSPQDPSKIEPSRPEALPPDEGDTLENALKTLERFRGKFSESSFNRMAAELRLIYEGRDLAPSPLYGQYAKDEAASADYTQFTPRSHYVKTRFSGVISGP